MEADRGAGRGRPRLHRANGELSEAVRNDLTSPDYRLEEPSFWAGESPAVPTPFYGVDHVEVVTGHGDHLGDHRLLYKGSEQYEQTTRAPFIWADPASDRRGRCDRLGQTLDIGATIPERARIEQAWGMQGRNLMAEESPPDSVLIQYAHQAPMDGIGVPPNVHSLRDARYRISVFEGLQWGELYDLETDPAELCNLWDDPGAAAQKARLLERLLRAELAHAETAPAPVARA